MSSKNSNRINVPEARKAMSNMKHEVASELGITLSEGYNGNIAANQPAFLTIACASRRSAGGMIFQKRS